MPDLSICSMNNSWFFVLTRRGLTMRWLGLDLAVAKHPEIFSMVPALILSCAKLVVYQNAFAPACVLHLRGDRGHGDLCRVCGVMSKW